MKRNAYIQKGLIVALLVLCIQFVYAAFSFTGIADERTKSKYSLKNLSALSHKSLSISSLKSSLQFKGLQQSASTRETGSGIEISSMLRYDNGNSTYIYPYKFKIKVPRFKTPAPQRN